MPPSNNITFRVSNPSIDIRSQLPGIFRLMRHQKKVKIPIFAISTIPVQRSQFRIDCFGLGPVCILIKRHCRFQTLEQLGAEFYIETDKSNRQFDCDSVWRDFSCRFLWLNHNYYNMGRIWLINIVKERETRLGETMPNSSSFGAQDYSPGSFPGGGDEMCSDWSGS
jgi:hypothetical protein